MKSEIKKGALYLIDDSFRERCATVTVTATSRWAATAMATVMVTATAMGTGTKYVWNYQPYKNGIVFLADIENHKNSDPSWDICKIVFNNDSGVRYIYRNTLELAERLDS